MAGLDLINAGFEVAATAALLPSVLRTWRSKSAQSASPWTPLFFGCWALFNLIYYPSLDQWLSAYAALMVGSVNLFWATLLWRYSKGASQ